MKTKLISNCLWFNNNGEQAAQFYTSLFSNAKINDTMYYGKEGFEIHGGKEGTVMLTEFELEGEKFIALNGGPEFKFNPGVSFFVVCENEEETDTLWNALLDGGKVLMPYQAYDWSTKYGWLTDRYGLSWQISFGNIADVGQKITPSLLMTGEQCGRAGDAIHFYTSIFKNSGIDGILKHGPNAPEPEGNIAHAQFKLANQKFMIMESANAEHRFAFNEAVSLVINCETQEEIDYYWERLTADGGKEIACGWLKDKFDVSWQVDSIALNKMLKDTDKEKVRRVTHAFLRMKKFDIAKLQEAFHGNVNATL